MFALSGKTQLNAGGRTSYLRAICTFSVACTDTWERRFFLRHWFTNPYWLLLLPVYAAFVYVWLDARRLGPGWPGLLRRHSPRWLAVQICAAVTLILAAADVKITSGARRLDVVIAADASKSIYDLATQSQHLQSLLQALPAEETRLATVVFAERAGTERNWQTLEEPAARTARERLPRTQKTNTDPRAVDLQNMTVQLDGGSTNLADAITYSRGLFDTGKVSGARAILLLSDFRQTAGNAEAAAAALSGARIDLLTTPAILADATDVQLAGIRVPDESRLGRSIGVEVTVQAQQPGTVRVDLRRSLGSAGSSSQDFFDSKTIELARSPRTTDFRTTVRFIDTPPHPGVALYTARVTGPQGELPNDVSINNTLSAAVRVTAPAHWAVLTRPNSTVAALSNNPALPLGVKTTLFLAENFPRRESDYAPFTGVLLDGLTARELPENSDALLALQGALDAGKGLLALGGDGAFGAGRHLSGGRFEKLLPVEMHPEDDRTRAILFVLDVSNSMAQRLLSADSGTRKIDFAKERLGQAALRLKPQDRVGLIAFAGTARKVLALTSAQDRIKFQEALHALKLDTQTDLLAALEEARRMLADDHSEEQLVVLISDGEQTERREVITHDRLVQAARELCPEPAQPNKPRRTRLYTFGIGVGDAEANPAGERLLQALATAGGATYSRDFLKLGERLEEAIIESDKDLFVRRELFNASKAYEHPLLAQLTAWPDLPFRNRVKAKPGTEVLLRSAPSRNNPAATKSRLSDPLLVLSGAQWPGAARRAVLALALDGPAGAVLLQHAEAQRLLMGLIDWVEGRFDGGVPGWTITTEIGGNGTLQIEAQGFDSQTNLPLNGRKPEVLLTDLRANAAAGAHRLHASAPGRYRAEVSAPDQSIYKVTVRDGVQTLYERLLALPYSAEFRSFGTDREAMSRLAQQAGSGSRVIERPVDLLNWVETQSQQRAAYSLRPWLLGLALLLILLEIGARGRRT